MPLKLFAFSKDLRTDTVIAYGQADIVTYLKLIGSDFADFNIQRRKETHKAYGRMKADIVKGAQLPAFTLAIKPDTVSKYSAALESQNLDALQVLLSGNPKLHILDGLQRTYILKDLEKSGTQFHADQKLLLEFWFEDKIKVLIYRIIVLNAGQKPMSLRHQVELLFETIVDKLREDIAGLEVLKERNEDTRTRSRQFQLARLVSGYQSFILKTPEVAKEDIVARQLMEEDLFDVTEDEAENVFLNFKRLLARYCRLDDSICKVYPSPAIMPDAPTGLSWWGSENVMNSFFSAVSDFANDKERNERVDRALETLEAMLTASDSGEDPLGLTSLTKLQKDINPRKVNVGFATRKLLSSAFKEFFRDEGKSPLAKLWAKEAVGLT